MQAPPGGLYSGWSDGAVGGRGAAAPNGRRKAGGILLLLTAVLLAVSLFTAWWTLSVAAGTDHASIDFYPGNAASASDPNGSASGTYSQAGVAGMASLYEAVFAMIAAGLALSALSGALGLLTELGVLRGWTRGRLLSVLALLGLLILLAVVLLDAAVQPTQFNQANPQGLCSEFARIGSSSPCNSFSGSISSGQDTISWGPGAGWYVAVLGVILGLAGTVVWNSGRQDPWEESTAPLEYPAYGTPAAYSAGPSFGAPAPSGIAGPAAPAPSTPPGGTFPAPPPPAPTTPPGAQPLSSEVVLYRIYVLKQRLDKGELDAPGFGRSKAQVLAERGPPRPAGSSQQTRQNLTKLEWLTDHGALTTQEQLEVRRRVLLGI